MAQTTLTRGTTVVRPAAANKRIKFAIGGVVVLVAVVYLIVNALGTTGQFFLTVSEVQAKGTSIYGRPLRVSGDIVPDSIDWNAPTLMLKFSITDGSHTMPVSFHGPKPDNMNREGSQAIVEGKLNADGVFQANTLLLKCPSRYEEMEITEVKAVQ
ncbi:MAG: cytochrome c maturation protein CcmE [Anaerolineae bacterium]|nr:cytochrome c maturation protein CcmE [Anaerolineae bacterium]